MKRISPASIISLIVAFFVLGLVCGDSALCLAQSHALLVQQTPSGAGIVKPEVGIHHFSSDSEVTLVAVPRPGYRFVYWLGDVLEPTANKTTALLDEPKIIIAVFEAVEEGQLIVGQNALLGGGGGGGGSFGSGSSISPAVNRIRRSVSGTSTPPANGGNPVVGPPNDDNPENPPEEDPETPPGETDPGVDPPDDDPPPIDPPPIDPPDVPEPATGLMLTLGAVALLRKRRSAKRL